MAIHLRSVAKRTWISVLRILLLLIIFLVMTVSWLIGTEGGRIVLVKQALHAWSLYSGQQVELTGLRTRSLSQWQVARVVYDGKQGVNKVEVNNISVNWRWRYALQNRWWFDELSIDHLAVEMDEPNNNGGQNLATLYHLWPNIPAMRIDRLRIDNLSLTRPRNPELQADVDVQLELNWGALPIRFLVSMQNSEERNKWALELSSDAIDQVRLQGSLIANPGTAWAQWIKWQWPEPAAAHWDVQVDYSEQNKLAFIIDQWRMPWQAHSFQADGQFTYQVDDFTFQFNPLTFDLDGQPGALSGKLAPEQSNLTISHEKWPLEPFAQLLSIEEFTGTSSVHGILQGGWRRPQFTGQASATGQWQGHDFAFNSKTFSERSILTLQDGELTLGNNRLSLTGTLDWIAEQADLILEGQVESDPVFRPWMNGILQDFQGSAQLTSHIAGDVFNPAIQFETLAEGLWQEEEISARLAGDWRNGQASFEQFNVYSDVLQFNGNGSYELASHDYQASLTVDTLRSEIFPSLKLNLPFDFSGSVAGDFELQGASSGFDLQGQARILGRWLDRPFNLTGNIESFTGSKIKFNETDVRLGSSVMSGKGQLDFKNQSFNLDLRHTDWPMEGIEAVIPVWPSVFDTLNGTLTGKTQISGLWSKPSITTQSEFKGSWFGETLTAQTTIEPQTATLWQVSTLDANWLGANWSYQGEFWPFELGLDGQVSIADLHTSWIPVLSSSFTGVEKSLPESFNLKLSADADLTGKITAPELAGQASLAGELEEEPLDMSITFDYLDSQRIEMSSAQGRWADGQWQLNGLLDWFNARVALDISTDSPNARYLLPWLTWVIDAQNWQWLEHWQGSLIGYLKIDNQQDEWVLSGDLASAGEFYDEEYEFHWQGEGKLRESLSHEMEAFWGVAEAKASLVSDASEVQGDVSLRWLSYEQLRYLWSDIPENLMGLVSADIELSGDINSPNHNSRLSTVGQFQAKYPHRFNANVALSGKGIEWLLSQTVFEIPGAVSISASGKGKGAQGNLLFEGILPNTQYWIEHAEVGAGEAGFQLNAEGDLLSPELTGTFNWNASNWPYGLSMVLATDGDTYRIDSALYHDQQPRVKSDLHLTRVSLLKLPELWKSLPLTANVTVSSPLSVLDPFFITQPDVRMVGDVNGEFSLQGSFASPLWDGKLVWQNGQFEHAAYGSLLRELTITIDAEAEKWLINASAVDSQKGAVTANGYVEFESTENEFLAHQQNITVSFDEAHLLNQAQMEAAVDGDLIITGPYHDVLLRGNIQISALNMQSDTFLSEGAPQLNIVSEDALLNAFEAVRPFYWPQGNWAVVVIADQRVNLYGQGINAELEGMLRVTKDLYEPELSGRFDLIRGTYSGLGRIFQLTDGAIRIQNNQMDLDIIGTNTMTLRIDDQQQSVEVMIQITGNQDALSLELTSDTDLEQDELLAQILFGKIIDDLDVLQAIQLANAVNRLRTGSSGFDLIGTTREEIGLDSLAVDTATDDEGNLGFNISAGKYLNDFIYLEVEQQVGAERDFRGSLQYQLTPNTNIELYTQGERGVFDENGLELNWSWDY